MPMSPVYIPYPWSLYLSQFKEAAVPTWLVSL